MPAHNHSDCESCSHGYHDDESSALEFSLYQKVNTNNFECLNEVIDGSGVKILKSWDQRLDTEIFVESDCDAELLMNIPFLGDVKLTTIALLASQDLSQVRIYKSKLRLSFDDMSAEPDQEFVLDTSDRETTELIQIPVKATKFSNVHHLTIHFVNKDRANDEKPCRLYYLGFKGIFTQTQRDAIVIANYEIRPTEYITKELKNNIAEIQ